MTELMTLTERRRGIVGHQRCYSSERILAILPATIQRHGLAMRSRMYTADGVFNANMSADGTSESTAFLILQRARRQDGLVIGAD
jgi:hypothetical protein